jgi:hypothetical protein
MIRKTLMLFSTSIIALTGSAAVAGDYPPMVFISSVSEEKLLEAIREVPEFAKIDDEALGSPIVLQVRHFTRMTAGGSAAGFGSAVLSGGTLGIIPIVTNNDLVVKYEFTVHGTPIASFEYEENFTEVESLYDMNTELEGEMLAWAEATVDQFIKDINGNADIQAVFDEYRYYFGQE